MKLGWHAIELVNQYNWRVHRRLFSGEAGGKSPIGDLAATSECQIRHGDVFDPAKL